MRKPKVGIVILNWNGWKDTLECLESLLCSDWDNYKIIVCDNASSDGSIDRIIAWADCHLDAPLPQTKSLRTLRRAKPTPVSYTLIHKSNLTETRAYDEKLILIQNGSNLGFAAGCNSGLAFAMSQDCDYFWLLNNDTIVTPTTLARMVEHTEANSKRGNNVTCGSVQLYYEDPNLVQAYGGMSYNPVTGIATAGIGDSTLLTNSYRQADVIPKLDAIQGCSWLLPRAFLEDIGLMDERYFLYYEEMDWSYRSRDKYALTYAENAYVYHKKGASIGSKTKVNAPSLIAVYHLNRSKIIFTKKFCPWYLPSVYLAALAQAVNFIRKQQPKQCIALLKSLFGLNLNAN